MTLLEEIRNRAVVTHHEKGNYRAGGYDWQWAECRLCLFSWQGMIPHHADDCPILEIEWSEGPGEKP